MVRKSALLSKKIGFQKGHYPANKGKLFKFDTAVESEPVIRLPHNVFESRVTQKSDKILTVLDVDQSPCPPMLLRPHPQKS